ncbi:MAG: fasciclin domain-containing protein [Anaerolineae bacterium]|nr:fasciclin domain-containing protein [Anaerolineae bacterium]
MRKLVLILALASLVFVGAAPIKAQDAPTQTIAEIAAGNADFSTLMAAVAAADPAYAAALSNPDLQFTVFAPTNAAFDALIKALNTTAADLLANKALLDVVLAYHVIPGAMPASGVAASNGVALGTSLPDVGTTDAGLPKNALVIGVADGKVTLTTSSGGTANVTATDIAATNGVIHVIDSVLVPADAATIASDMAGMMEATPDAMAAAPVSIAETVVAAAGAEAKEFTTLLAAVQAADPLILTELSKGGPYTVFAPTDAAFEAALTAMNLTAEQLLADKATLTAVLAYHVIPGEFKAATVVAATANGEVKVATELPGQALTISQADGKVMVNDATVVQTDIAASNGIIHVIDKVLMPTM